MKSYEEMLESLYAREKAYQAKKIKRKKAAFRVTGLAACFVVCAAVALGSYGQSEPPVTPGISEELEQISRGESFPEESREGESFSETSSKEPDQPSFPPDESSEEPDQPSLPPEESERTPIYSEIHKVERDVLIPDGDIGAEFEGGGIYDEESVNSTTFGQALTLKMLLKTDEPAYLFDVVLYLEATEEKNSDEIWSEAFAVITQNATVGISIGDWLPVEWFTEGNAYYCRLTARELFVLNSYGITCLYVGSGDPRA